MISCIYLPNQRYPSVFDIPFEQLSKMRKRAIIFDIDNTLLLRNQDELSPMMRELIEELKSRFRICFLSNVIIESKAKRARNIGASVNVPVICCRFSDRKPKKEAYEKALKELKARPDEAVMIGDQLFTDIVGANRLGIYTTYVRPMGPDIWISYLIFRRWREKRILRSL